MINPGVNVLRTIPRRDDHLAVLRDFNTGPSCICTVRTFSSSEIYIHSDLLVGTLLQSTDAERTSCVNLEGGDRGDVVKSLSLGGCALSRADLVDSVLTISKRRREMD